MPKKKIILPIVLGLVILTAGFFGGVFYQKKAGGNKTGMPSGTPPQMSGDGSSSRQGGPGGNGGGGMSSGEIISKDDSKITIKLTDGSTKIIYYTDSTKISKNQTGSSSDLTVGTKVNVNGTTNSDKSIAGETIMVQ